MIFSISQFRISCLCMFALMSFSVKFEFIKSGLNLHFCASKTGKIAKNTTINIKRLNKNIFDFIPGVKNIHFIGPFFSIFKGKFFKEFITRCYSC